jgi:tetratricopeptide (TPR) repeat protein
MLGLAVAAGARVVYAATVTPGAQAGLRAGISPWRYLLAQGPVILRYLRLLIVPYGFTVDADIHVPALWVGLLAWAGIVALAVFLWRYRRYAWATWLLAGLILLIPSSSLFPAADLSADRRMYLPMLGFAAAAGWLLTRVRTEALAVVVAVALTAVSIGRTQVWMTEERLWREAVRRAPEKVRPKIQLARAVPAAEALELLAAARRLAPYDPAVPAETGKILLSEGQPVAALEEFGRALALDPLDARNFNNRGVALDALGQTEAARQDFERALRIDPGLTEARQNLEKLPPPGR